MSKLTSSEIQKKIEERPSNTILRNLVDPNYDNMAKFYSHRLNIKLPINFDGREVWKGLISPVTDQGNCGACWALASTSCLADRFNIQSLGKMNIRLSASKLILCDWQGEEIEADPDHNKKGVENIDRTSVSKTACYGNSLYDAWRYLYIIGTCEDECVPYHPTNQLHFETLAYFKSASQIPLCTDITGPIGDMCADFKIDKLGGVTGTPMRLYRAYHFYIVPGMEKDKGSIYNIMNNIYLWGPVCSAIQLYEDFYTFNFSNGNIYESDQKGRVISGHAIVIVGWGESRSKKYWIIRNSWGRRWGDDGYFKIARGSNNCKIEENVVAGVPDFFYPKDYRGIATTYNWAEIDKFIKERKDIDWPIQTITGGGIDPTTGYTRRAMKEYPNLILPPPIKLDQLPDWNTFIAAHVVSKKNRNYLILIPIVIVIVIVIILYFLHKKNMI